MSEYLNAFQAIGAIIGGIVEIDGNLQIKIQRKIYSLYPSKEDPGALRCLRNEVKQDLLEKGVSPDRRLIVHPYILHLPGSSPYSIAFHLVAFEGKKEQSEKAIAKRCCEAQIARVLSDWDFQLFGLWQFIPVCRVPCVSVFRNPTPDRLSQLKAAKTPAEIAPFKATHVPLHWNDAPVRPFRFKRGIETQEKPYFVRIKARFNPDRDVFEFVSLIDTPTTDAPRFLKAPRRQQGSREKTPRSVKPSRPSKPSNHSATAQKPKPRIKTK